MTTLKSADSRVRKVVAILRPEIGSDHINIRTIEQEIGFFDATAANKSSGETWPPYPQSAADKNAARRFAKALNKLEDWLATIEGGPEAAAQSALLQRMIHSQTAEFFEWKSQLTHWRKRFEALAHVDRAPNLFFPKGDESKATKTIVLQRKAAAVSATILRDHGLPLAATPKRLPSKASLLIQVAESLSAGLNLKVEYECRKLARTNRHSTMVGSSRKSRNWGD